MVETSVNIMTGKKMNYSMHVVQRNICIFHQLRNAHTISNSTRVENVLYVGHSYE